MKRLAVIGVLLLAALAVLVIGTGARSDDAYKVRAIFDNAGFLVPGEDVKSAGVVIGTIDSLDVTRDKKAVVVLKITDPAFRDFKQDARCQVRLQSLLGEKFVACTPTVPKAPGEAPALSLRQIASGPGAGEYLLPVENTASSVDLDMLNNVMRLPERQRFMLIINEFGTGLAGNGDELRAAIRRANPVLDAFDDVVRILADQDRVLATLAEDGDRALQPLARESAAISEFIDKAGETATATAERGDALEQNFALFPELLAELEPTMAELETFTRAATPVFTDFRAAAPFVNQMFEQLGPFSTAAVPTLRTLGDAAEISRRALTAARPVIEDIRGLARATGPLARDLALGLSDLERQKGIDRFMRTVFGFTGALNGFDSVGHYVRSHLVLVSPCFNYAITAYCPANFPSAASASVANTGEGAGTDAADTRGESAEAHDGDALALPRIALPGDRAEQPADDETAAAGTGPNGTGAGTGAAEAGAGGGAGADAAGSGAEDPRAGVLGYLLGSEAVR